MLIMFYKSTFVLYSVVGRTLLTLQMFLLSYLSPRSRPNGLEGKNARLSDLVYQPSHIHRTIKREANPPLLQREMEDKERCIYTTNLRGLTT